MKTIKLTPLALGLVCAVSGQVSAQEVLKLGHVYEVESSYHQASLEVAKEFEAQTDGRYKIEVFPASQLGKESALNEGISLGTVDVIYTSLSFLEQSYGPIGISDYPFTLRDFEHWKAYANSELFNGLSENYTAVTGNKIAALTYYGSRHVTSNKPITTPEDMKGLKIRTPNAAAYQLFPKAVGANPTPIAFSEVYLALQQGVVDAQENPLPTIKFKRFYEVQSNINLTGHMISTLATLVSPYTLQKMEPKDQQALFNAFKKAAEKASNRIRQSELDLISWYQDQGIKVNELDRQPFMKMVEPQLKLSSMPWEPELYDQLQSIQ